ncbi:hypothetical protein GCM10025868_02160 [Angustibacter aerolatus]|uniref:ABC transporter domain-containing protein n=1 Tax=Angustibacter aerolatus TaxID=1162965 RepID=A0ABQ6JDV6_9ACTN|nr:hypothetical protein GCM10025868_02160 [Angustibacter aerolatus]
MFTDVDLAIDRGSKVVVLGLNGAGKTTLLRMLAGIDPPDTGEVLPGHGLRLGYYAQEHETLDTSRSVLENMRSAAPDLGDTEVRKVLGSFLFSGDDAEKPVGVLSGGEKTRLALATLVVSAANVLLLDEPTNNLDPASRDEVLGALRAYAGAVVLVTHDEGAVHALEPERVLLLPDGDEDLWSPEYAEARRPRLTRCVTAQGHDSGRTVDIRDLRAHSGHLGSTGGEPRGGGQEVRADHRRGPHADVPARRRRVQPGPQHPRDRGGDRPLVRVRAPRPARERRDAARSRRADPPSAPLNRAARRTGRRRLSDVAPRVAA